MKKVYSKTATWVFCLMLIAPGSILIAEDPPLSQDQTGRDGEPVETTPVPPALHQALASPLGDAALFGAKVIPTPPTGTWGIVSEGNGGGGIFRDSDSEAEAWLGTNGYGVEGFGTTMGGYFKDTSQSGYAYLGYGDYGILAYGNSAGGYFKDRDHSGYAYLGYGDRGISAYGSEMGGYFKDTNQSGYAYAGYGNYGIWALGDTMGGYFKDSSNTGYAYVGYVDYGIRALGSGMGGYFKDSDGTGYANVGIGNAGIQAYGSLYGGFFQDSNSSSFAQVGISPYKIAGSGTVSFVQNHPYDPSSVIVYAAPEGDEVATYTRGTARLADGEATVPLGETFKWVTNPDIGLTAHLTPRGEPIPLAVVELSTEEMIVRAPSDAPDGLEFDYMVYGLRIGFEELSIVQEKEMESYIPSMADDRDLYERRPDLKSYNSLERFKGMHHAIDPKAKLDLSRAQALRDAIIEFDPAVHELPKPPGFEEMPVDDLALDEGQREAVRGHDQVRAAQAGHDKRPATDHPTLGNTIPVDNEGNVYAPSFRPSSQDLASLVTVSEAVEPGDVLVIDRSSVGMMRRGAESHDTGVIGVVTAEAGIVLGTQRLAAREDGEATETSHRAAVALAGVVSCKVDAGFGAIWPGDLLVTSPTPGHAMRTDAPLPGTMIGKALEPLEEGIGTIKVLVMLR